MNATAASILLNRWGFPLTSRIVQDVPRGEYRPMVMYLVMVVTSPPASALIQSGCTIRQLS